MGVSLWISPASQTFTFLKYICFNIFVQLTIWNNKTNQSVVNPSGSNLSKEPLGQTFGEKDFWFHAYKISLVA